MSSFVNPAAQAMNLIRYIGDRIIESGEPISQLSGFAKSMGASSQELADGLLEELYNRSLVKMWKPVKTFNGTTFMNVDLSLDGWGQYDAGKRGQLDGNYGFIAMQFGDPDLDLFVKDVVKPAVKEATSYDLVNMNGCACRSN